MPVSMQRTDLLSIPLPQAALDEEAARRGRFQAAVEKSNWASAALRTTASASALFEDEEDDELQARFWTCSRTFFSSPVVGLEAVVPNVLSAHKPVLSWLPVGAC